MKFDATTLKILKSFTTINPSIVFKPGTVLSTMSPGKTIMARAKINQEIEDTFAVYDLSRFLGTLSLFNDPDMEVNEKFMTIKEGRRKINYTFTEPSLVVSPPDREIKFPGADVSFDITAPILSEVTKALSVLSLPELGVVGDGSKVYVTAMDSKNPSGDVYSVEVGETEDTFRLIVATDNLRILNDDYRVDVSSKGLARFTSALVQYHIAVESHSTYEGK